MQRSNVLNNRTYIASLLSLEKRRNAQHRCIESGTSQMHLGLLRWHAHQGGVCVISTFFSLKSVWEYVAYGEICHVKQKCKAPLAHQSFFRFRNLSKLLARNVQFSQSLRHGGDFGGFSPSKESTKLPIIEIWNTRPA